MKILMRDLSAFWSMFHVIFLFVILFRSRYPKKKTVLLAAVGMGLLMLLNGVGLVVLGLEAMGKLFFFTCSIPSFVFFYVLSADKGFRYILTFCLADTFCLWIMGVTLLLDSCLGGGRNVLLFVSRLLLLPLAEYFAYRFLRKPYLELQASVERGWGVFAGMTMLYYVLLTVMLYYPVNIENRPEDFFLCLLILLLMGFNYATIFFSLYNQLLLFRKQQSERSLQEQKVFLETKLENQQQIRRLKHDMKAYTITLSGLLAAGNTEQAVGYLRDIGSKMDAVMGQFCPNPYLNAVVSHYSQKLQEMGVELKPDIQVGEEELPYLELCQILTNGLENACDALEGLSVQERSEVSVQMKYNRGYLTIRIMNPCREGLCVEKGELPATGKKETGHGYGLPTVRDAAKKLGGDMLCYTQEGSFVLDVMVKSDFL